jgi:hypothetical protein
MIETLSDLTHEQRVAIMLLGAQVISSTTEGKINTADEDFRKIADAILEFPSLESGIVLNECISMDAQRCIGLLSSLSNVEKNAVRFIISSICHDNATRAFVAGSIMKKCGFQTFADQEQRNAANRYSGREDEDQGTVINDAYVRLIDTGAIRFEPVETFTLYIGDSPQPVEINSDFNDWIQKEWCPSNGMVGIICKKESTDEGTLCFVVFNNKIVVPILEDGLEQIEDYDWRLKSVNNFILAHDKGGKRCQDLRDGIHEPRAEKLKKVSNKRRIKYVASKQDRFQIGQYFPTSFVERIITLDYDESGTEVDINVLGIMQPKHARLYEDTGRVLKYSDTSLPGYRYEVETDPETNEIVRFSIFVGDFVEYRYTN